jgi:hypothetical protein
MVAQMLSRLRPKALIAAIFVIFPAILFYAILFRQASDIPMLDDYHALLGFLNHMAGLRSVSAKTSYFLAAQHNEYKLFFEHGIVWLEFAIFGHIHLRLLCALGNGFILLLAILLWKMFLPNHKDFASRLAFFVPASWLLFQLQYIGALNWAMTSLAGLSVLFFSLGAIYLLVGGTWRAFCGALIFLVLAIASSGNGLLVVPVGILVLVLGRRHASLVTWIFVSAGCVAAYSYHYNIMSSRSPIHHSVISAFMGLQPLFVITFIGNAVVFPVNHSFFGFEVILCFLLGIVLCVFFFYLVRIGYYRKNPLVSYCVLFLLLTAVGVAGIRSDFGVEQSLQSRYGIYSALLLIFAWFAIAEEFLQHKTASIRYNGILLAAILSTVLFSLGMDVAGWCNTVERNRDLVRGMAEYEHPITPQSTVGPILPMPNQGATWDVVDQQARAILIQSIDLGIYRPPAY